MQLRAPLPVPYGSVVYCAVNKANGKRYVGKSSNWPAQRLEHKRTKLSTHFGRAIRKYGIDGFRWDILFANANDAALARAEAAFIALYGCRSEAGYNLTDGGEGAPGRVHSEETKRKIGDALMGRKNPETAARMRGRKHTAETKVKLSALAKGRKRPYVPQHRKRKVCNTDLVEMIRLRDQGETLVSIGDMFGVSPSYVCKLYRGRLRCRRDFAAPSNHPVTISTAASSNGRMADS